MSSDATQDQARRIARDAFLVFEHKEGSRLIDEKYAAVEFEPTAAAQLFPSPLSLRRVGMFPQSCDRWGSTQQELKSSDCLSR